MSLPTPTEPRPEPEVVPAPPTRERRRRTVRRRWITAIVIVLLIGVPAGLPWSPPGRVATADATRNASGRRRA